jgi:hypothetical protein
MVAVPALDCGVIAQVALRRVLDALAVEQLNLRKAMLTTLVPVVLAALETILRFPLPVRSYEA